MKINHFFFFFKYWTTYFNHHKYHSYTMNFMMLLICLVICNVLGHLLPFCDFHVFQYCENNARTFQPVQDQNLKFFENIRLSWFKEKIHLKMCRFNLVLTKSLRKTIWGKIWILKGLKHVKTVIGRRQY